MKNHRHFLLTSIIFLTLLTAGCSLLPPSPPASGAKAEKTGTTLYMADRTPIEVWETDAVTQYRLTDGTVILEADRPAFLEELPPDRFYPDPVRPGRDFGFRKLDQTVRDAVRAFYEEQSAHFSLSKQLSRSWNIYKKYGQDPGYHPFHITWRFYPCADSERVLYIMTEEETLRDEWSTDTFQITTAFDKTTGEVLPSRDLFACSIEELAEYMVRRSGLSDEEKMQELIRRFSLQYLVVYPGQTNVWYPEGTLEGQTPAKYWLTLDHNEEALNLYHPWARPYTY